MMDWLKVQTERWQIKQRLGLLLQRERQQKATNSQWAKAKAYTKTTTMRMKRQGVDSGNVGQN